MTHQLRMIVKTKQEADDSNSALREPHTAYSLMHIQPPLPFHLRKQNSVITHVLYTGNKFDLRMEVTGNRGRGQGIETGAQSDPGARQIVLHNHLLCFETCTLLCLQQLLC
jgi:hypothetical protein